MEDAGMKQATLIVFWWLVLGFTVQAASFDCAKAGTKVEHIICDTPEISKLDKELNSAYKTALQDKAKEKQIRQEQKQWLKNRSNCTDADCVKLAYEKRLSTLQMAVVTPNSTPVFKKRFVVTEGKGYTICESYSGFLNSLPEEESMPICHPKLSPAFPDLKEPDWEVMNISENLELVYKIEKITTHRIFNRPIDTFDHWKAIYEQQIRSGEASPRLRRTHLALLENSPVETILEYVPDRNACKDRRWDNVTHTSLYIWNKHEQKLEPYISRIAFAGLPRELLLFQGKPFTFWIGWEFPRNNNVSGELDVNYFKKVGTETYANLPRCRINFEMPRDLYERMIK
jgi:uncharacterized protein YecT (DUF1311 family)